MRNINTPERNAKDRQYREQRAPEPLTKEYLETVKALAQARQTPSLSKEEELDTAVRWLYPDHHNVEAIKRVLNLNEKDALIRSWKHSCNQTEVEEALLWIYPECFAQVRIRDNAI